MGGADGAGGTDACNLTTATSATSCVMNTDQASVLHCGAIMVTAAAVVPYFPTRTSWGQAWSGLPTPTAVHGSRSCGRTRLVSSVCLCLCPQAGQSNLNLLERVALPQRRARPSLSQTQRERGSRSADILGTVGKPLSTLAQQNRTPRWFSDLSINVPTFMCCLFRGALRRTVSVPAEPTLGGRTGHS